VPKKKIREDLNSGKLDGKRSDKGLKEWQIPKKNLFALYPGTDKQKCKRLEAELEESRNTILDLEKRLKGEISRREELEQLLEQTNEKIDVDMVKTCIVFRDRSEYEHNYDYNYECVNSFLLQHIDKIIDILELFSSTDYDAKISPSICIRLMANYNHELERFKNRKKEYEYMCNSDSRYKSDIKDAYFEKFVYSIKNYLISDYITKGRIPRGVTVCNPSNKPITESWVIADFKFT
jgi:hypothetical protein